MGSFKILTFILLFLGIVTLTKAQENILSKNEIIKLAKEANSDRESGNYEQSLLKSRIALQNSIFIKNNSLIANSYNNIAANFDELGEADKAFPYYKKALIYANKTNNNILKHQVNNNLGNIYCFDKKQYEIGINYYKKSLEYSKILKDSAQLVFTNLNITWAYFDLKQFKNGLPYLNFINKYHSKFGDESTIVALNMLNGMHYDGLNENKIAEKYYLKAIEFGKKGEEKSDLSFTYLEYSKLLSKNKEFEKAYSNLSLYYKITDELNSEEKIKKANTTGINLQIDEYKRDVDKITTAYNTKKSLLLEAKKRNKIIVLIFLSLLLLLFFIAVIYTKNKALKFDNKIIKLQNNIHQNIINTSVDVQETERKNTALFLHNNISTMLASAVIQLNIHQSQNKSITKEVTETKSILEEIQTKVSDYSHSILPTLLAKFGLFYALEDLCQKNSNETILIEYSTTILIKTRYDEGFEMKIYYIISELINNIIKHSQASLAKITIEENESQLIFKLLDNGIGFDTMNFDFIEGFGLNQIKARVKKMNGEFKVKSTKNFGTIIALKVAILH